MLDNFLKPSLVSPKGKILLSHKATAEAVAIAIRKKRQTSFNQSETIQVSISNQKIIEDLQKIDQ